MRTFVAIELPRDIKEQIARIQSQLKTIPVQVSWVKPENIHLTFKFLGEIDEAKIEEVAAAVQKGCQVAKSFRISLKGVGAFPNLKRPRVVWVGTSLGEAQLSSLQKKVEMELAKIGFPKEERGFSPHFTIGRIRIPQDTEKLSQAVEGVSFSTPEFEIKEVVVMKSQLHPAGSIYTPLKKITLQN